MHIRGRLLSSRGAAVAIFVGWLCSAGAAWAGGGGGEDLGTLQGLIDGICGNLGMTSCPQLPTITQAILELAGFGNSPPEIIRSISNIPPGVSVDAGNAPTTAPAVLANELPIAFTTGSQGQVVPTKLYDPRATSYFYAVATAPSAGPPDTLALFYEYVPRVVGIFVKNQSVASISLPLVALNHDGSERSVPATLQVLASCTGGTTCLSASVAGDFLGNGTTQTHSVADLGMQFQATFGPSPTAQLPHLMLQVQVKLLITAANNPAYFFNPFNSFVPAVFSGDELGFTPAFLGLPIGIAPDAAAFNASFSSVGLGQTPLRPAIAAFAAIATDGETLVSAPLASH